MILPQKGKIFAEYLANLTTWQQDKGSLVFVEAGKERISSDITKERVYFTKVMLDRSGCISYELCAEICPEVFRMVDDGIAKVYQGDVPESAEAITVETQEGCPVSVIIVD